MSRCYWCGREPCICGLEMYLRTGPRREVLLERLVSILRARRLAIEAHMLAEATIECMAAALFKRMNPDDEWEDASVEMKETWRCDAEAAVMAAFRGC